MEASRSFKNALVRRLVCERAMQCGKYTSSSIRMWHSVLMRMPSSMKHLNLGARTGLKHRAWRSCSARHSGERDMSSELCGRIMPRRQRTTTTDTTRGRRGEKRCEDERGERKGCTTKKHKNAVASGKSAFYTLKSKKIQFPVFLKTGIIVKRPFPFFFGEILSKKIYFGSN